MPEAKLPHQLSLDDLLLGHEAPAQGADAQEADPAAPTRLAPSGQSTPAPPLPSGDTLEAIRADLGDCQRCGLCAQRSHIVFGVGAADARVMFVGEGPGAEEDRRGEPFVGRAGELLTRMIGAMGLRRSDVYIANVVKCRPPNNRDPLPDEVARCEPFLLRQIAAVAPDVIVTLGRFAAQSLLESDVGITRLRGTWQHYHGIAVMPTLHPAYLLRNPSAKRDVWEDLRKVMARLAEGEGAKGVPR